MIVVALMLISVSSCSSMTPHENFKSLMSHNVGSSIDMPRVAGSARAEYLLGSKILPNGNIENQYRGRGTCRVFFEFDPITSIIVNWRFEGGERDCEIVP